MGNPFRKTLPYTTNIQHFLSTVKSSNCLIESVSEGIIGSSKFGLPKPTEGTDDPHEYTGACGKLAASLSEGRCYGL
ncbi:MAG: hypothetical protein QXP27_06355, partial [Candidatus Methanomethyliaceae archaeon]